MITYSSLPKRVKLNCLQKGCAHLCRPTEWACLHTEYRAACGLTKTDPKTVVLLHHNFYMLLNWLTHNQWAQWNIQAIPGLCAIIWLLPFSPLYSCVNLDHCLALPVCPVNFHPCSCPVCIVRNIFGIFLMTPCDLKVVWYQMILVIPYFVVKVDGYSVEMSVFLFLNFNYKNKIYRYLKSHMLTFWQWSLFVKAHLKWVFCLLKRGRKGTKWPQTKVQNSNLPSMIPMPKALLI